MCFHLIVYIPLRRLSPYCICIVARGFCANNRVSTYAWPVFTEPNGPIRHRQRKRNTENDVLLSQYRPFSLYLFAASALSAGRCLRSFLIACSYWILLGAAGVDLIISPCGGEIEETGKCSFYQHTPCHLLAPYTTARPLPHLSYFFSVLEYSADKLLFGKFLPRLTSEGALPCSEHKWLPAAPILSLTK
jgi:hypothetical protein